MLAPLGGSKMGQNGCPGWESAQPGKPIIKCIHIEDLLGDFGTLIYASKLLAMYLPAGRGVSFFWGECPLLLSGNVF